MLSSRSRLFHYSLDLLRPRSAELTSPLGGALLYADPVVAFQTCGNACCPMGFDYAKGDETCKIEAYTTALQAPTDSTTAALLASTSSPTTATTSYELASSTTRTSTSSSALQTSTTKPQNIQEHTNDRLNATSGSLLGVLIVSRITTVLIAGWWCARWRRLRRKKSAAARVDGLYGMYQKSELDGTTRLWRRLSPHEFDSQHSPRELYATPKRPHTLNSVRQELDAPPHPSR